MYAWTSWLAPRCYRICLVNRLLSNIVMLERCNKDWSTFKRWCKGHRGMNIAEGDEGFVEVMLFGNEVMA